MEHLSGTLPGSLTVARDTLFSGIAHGGATVAAGATLTLTGIVNGDVAIALGGRALLSGMIHGSVINDGVAEVRGMVSGTVSGTGKTTIDPRAMIGRAR